MTEEVALPPPFIVSETYEDEIGEYKVLFVEGIRMAFERPDGTRAYTNNISLKADIYKRRVSEREHPRPLNFQQSKAGSGAAEYKYEIVTPLVAEIIDGHSKYSAEYLPHSSLKNQLLDHPHGRSIIDNISPTHKLRTAEAWAGVIIAGFSKEWKMGKWERFERKKIGRGHAWRVRRK